MDQGGRVTHVSQARHPYAFGEAVGNGTAHFDREVASVDIVSEKQVPRVCGVASNFEELHQVELIDGACSLLATILASQNT